jgi:hypothetical protein
MAKCGLRAFEKKVLTELFWNQEIRIRKFHNSELQYVYSSPDVINVIKLRGVCWVSHVVHMDINEYTTSLGKRERKRLLGRPNYRCRIILKWNLEKLVRVLVNTAMNFCIP